MNLTLYVNIQLLFPEGHGGGNAPSVSLRVGAVLHLRQGGEKAAEHLDIDPGWRCPVLQTESRLRLDVTPSAYSPERACPRRGARRNGRLTRWYPSWRLANAFLLERYELRRLTRFTRSSRVIWLIILI